MPDLTPNHPAVEAAAREIYARDAPGNDPHKWPQTRTGEADYYRGTAQRALPAALPHLTAATSENLARLRNTPAGRAIMAEAWEKGVLSGAVPILESDGSMVIDLSLPNPYREEVYGDRA